MPERETIERVRRDKQQGKAPTTQAGEFIREEIHHIREGKHGARSAKQAIAIGLSKARRAGVDLPPKKGIVTTKAPQSTKRGNSRSRLGMQRHKSMTRSRAILQTLKREGHDAASHRSLALQAHNVALSRTAASRSQSAKKAARTKGRAARSAAARKASRTRKQTVGT